ncbi:MAG: helix-turn-helix transcriptional regulator [Oscillospiraceae bacterium]
MKGMATCRKAAGLTQAAFAEAIGVDRSAVAKWEAGAAYPSADKLPVIAKTLGCSIDALYGAPA